VGNTVDVKVTQESFGKLLAWFGPFKDNNGNETFLHRMLAACCNPWFHGNLPYQTAYHLLFFQPSEKVFLVRYSTIPGKFTVQTRNSCFSVTREAGQYTLDTIDGHTILYPSLKLLVEKGVMHKYNEVYPCTYFQSDIIDELPKYFLL